ncbi:hypothetical protein E1B28_007172 [Marasmius oreades]|uniref:Restriction of telomere capping protein 4 n=1 Tax=Marasmius oreades TaxID=181124 RepID=A0A9P7UT57_9AGAR|nr:uncharacterized protein E1B28_007172 [Marasmius oreades]KAG7093497.1 hypothetical protein E1B28_007172 [Marasmius oreades]
MERYQDGLSLQGSSVGNDTKTCLDRRPLARSEALYEDLGESGFNASRPPRHALNRKDSKGIGSGPFKGRRGDPIKLDVDDSGSEDELLLSEDKESSMDCVVGRSKTVDQEKKLEPEDIHQKAVLRTKSLQGLKFNKHKTNQSTGDKSTSKENQRSMNSGPHSEDSDSRAQKQLPGRKPSFPDQSSSVLKPACHMDRNEEQPISTNSSRSKPQATSSQSSEKNTLHRKPTTRSKTSQHAVSLSPDEEEKVNSKREKIRRGRKPNRVSHSSPSASPERTVNRKPRGFPELSPLKTGSGEFSAPSRFPCNEDPDRTPAPNKSKPRQLPLPSPLSSQPASDYTNAKGKEKSRHEESRGLSKTRPFPLAIGGDSTGSSSPSDTSMGGRARKRLSDDVEANDLTSRKRKRRENAFSLSQDIVLQDTYDHEEEEDYDSFFNSNIDPKMLCPFCDSRLPEAPSPLLQSMIKDAVEKSIPQPRPTNRLGRKAAMNIYIHICQRHHFEAELLPQAEAKGWPKTIEFNKLEARVAKLRSYLQGIVEDDKWQDQMSGDSDLWELVAHSPRALCIFWQEALKDVKEKGSKVAANVKNQFSSFDRTQPGYYGELGSIIIHHALYDLFPPASIEPKLVEPLDPKEFIQRVLVPEVGVRLIMEDRKLRGASGFNEAVEILRESSAYGVAMFPEDDGGSGDSRKSHKREGTKSETATVDAMLQAKARRRRIELAEEEEAEREENEIWRQKKKKPHEAPVATIAQPAATRPRPKPKRAGKQSFQTEGPETESAPSELEYDDIDGGLANVLSEKDRLGWDELMKLEAEWKQMDIDFNTLPPSSLEGTPMEIPIPSSPSGSQTSRSGHKSKRKAAERANSRIISISSEGSSDEADSRSEDNQPKRKRKAASRTPKLFTDDNDNTPKPPKKSVLQMARERKHKGDGGSELWSRSMRSDPPSSPVSPAHWLLSDDSKQSSQASP